MECYLMIKICDLAVCDMVSLKCPMLIRKRKEKDHMISLMWNLLKTIIIPRICVLEYKDYIAGYERQGERDSKENELKGLKAKREKYYFWGFNLPFAPFNSKLFNYFKKIF